MSVKLIEDLRFVIGLFFGIVSTILFLVGFTTPPTAEIPLNMNWIASGYMGLFAIFMVGSSLWSLRKEQQALVQRVIPTATKKRAKKITISPNPAA
jgi:putative Mn2+ efflux pump MntP